MPQELIADCSFLWDLHTHAFSAECADRPSTWWYEGAHLSHSAHSDEQNGEALLDY
jgi:hypothetical protein